MPFLLYRVETEKNGGEIRYTRERQIVLGGKSGPFAKHVQEKYRQEPKEDMFWEMEESKIVQALGCDQADKMTIIIDMKPNVKGNVSLYRLKRVWGYSQRDWTPIAVQLMPLHVDKIVADPEQFKAGFNGPCKNELVHEFLYLQGGTQEGTWAWGRVGSVNGALLWPKVFNEFAKTIQEYTK
jgi:hypothetical protein